MAPPPAKAKTLQPNRDLPSAKDQKAFKETLVAYESKEHKKGLKLVDGILAKKPDHGESLCMKGIFLHSLGRQDEGYECVRRGLTHDPESHICWHVHALMLKSDHRYREALECYIQAVAREDQPNLIRDTISLHLYFRQYTETVELRSRMLRLQPKLRQSWLAMAIALHLAGRHEEASKILLSYFDMSEDVPKRDYETSEVVLFQAMLLRAQSKTDDALHWLDSHTAQVVDRPSFDRLRAELLLETSEASMAPNSSAALAWNTLFEDNPEDRRNVEGYLSARGAACSDPSRRADSLSILDEMAARAPKSSAVRFTALRVDEGESFEKRARVLLRDWLLKGVPSLFTAVRSLYADTAKRDTIERIVEGYRDSLEAHGTLDAPSGEATTVDPPTAYTWTLYFLAQHCSHLGRHTDALRHIDAALEHTPVLPELLMMRARLLKRAGDVVGAESTMTAARELDGQDRFLNCKAVKYHCRNDHPDEAQLIAGLFTRKEAPSPLADLVDLQALWFIQEQGDAYRRMGKHGLALKRYHQIAKIFTDFRDDEADFHSWCPRKGTIRAYLRLLDWENTVKAHPAFAKAAQAAVEIYLELADSPSAAASQPNGVHVNGTTTPAPSADDDEARKAAKKARKAEAKAARAATTAPPPTTADAKKPDELASPPDPDPNGDALATTSTPLDEALKFVAELVAMAPSRLVTWLLSFDVAMKRGKHLEALKALRHGLDIDRTSPELHVRLASFFTLIGSQYGRDDDDRPLAAYLRKALETLSPVSSVDTANAELLQRHAGSPRHIFAAAQALLIARGPQSGREEAEALVFQLTREETRCDLETLVRGHETLRGLSSDRADEFRAACAQRMPLANAFMTPDVLGRHREDVLRRAAKTPPTELDVLD